MSDLDGLVPWLHGQLDAREKLARAAAEAVEGADWSPRGDGGVAARGPRGLTVALGPDGYMAPAVEDHIAEHDPARALAEISAIREVIYLAERAHDYHETFLNGFGSAMAGAVRLFAVRYADRPGYKETWRP